jgi:hypothetical protein
MVAVVTPPAPELLTFHAAQDAPRQDIMSVYQVNNFIESITNFAISKKIESSMRR